MQNFGWIQYVVLFAFMGMSVASWVFGQLREQTRRKKARDDARRRYEEQLRTGRAADPGSKPAAPRQAMSRAQQLAARRQAQLEELRRRQRGTLPPPPPSARPQTLVRSPQQGVARPTGRPPSGVVVQRVPVQGSPVPTPPGPTSQGSPVAQRQQRARATVRSASGLVQPPHGSLITEHDPRDIQRLRDQFQNAQKEAQRQRTTAKRTQRAPITSEQGATPENDPISRDVRAMIRGTRGLTPNSSSLQSLILATEILSKPMSMRTEHELPWSER